MKNLRGRKLQVLVVQGFVQGQSPSSRSRRRPRRYANCHSASAKEMPHGFQRQPEPSRIPGPAAAGLALTLVPRHVLGGPGYVIPGDKITLAYIGCGTQGTGEMLRLIAVPEVQITAVCDPVKDGTNYVDWDKTGIRDSVRRVLKNTDWGAGVTGIRAANVCSRQKERLNLSFMIIILAAKDRPGTNGRTGLTDVRRWPGLRFGRLKTRLKRPRQCHSTVLVPIAARSIALHQRLARTTVAMAAAASGQSAQLVTVVDDVRLASNVRLAPRLAQRCAFGGRRLDPAP